MHGYLNAAIVILQADIAGYVFEAYLFGARGQMNRTGDFIRVQVVGVEIQLAVDARELHVGAGRLEGNIFGDAGELNALFEFAVQL
jgi:hypothetical protein